MLYFSIVSFIAIAKLKEAMISIRVKTQLLEIAVSSDNSSLSEVVEAAIKVGESQPVQASLQEPIILKALPAAARGAGNQQQSKLPFIHPQPLPDGDADAEPAHPVENKQQQQQQQQQKKKQSPSGKGEGAVACAKILELKSKDFFAASKNFSEVQSALSTMGYTIKSNRLGEALLKLVREGHLAREGEKGVYTYRLP